MSLKKEYIYFLFTNMNDKNNMFYLNKYNNIKLTNTLKLPNNLNLPNLTTS